MSKIKKVILNGQKSLKRYGTEYSARFLDESGQEVDLNPGGGGADLPEGVEWPTEPGTLATQEWVAQNPGPEGPQGPKGDPGDGAALEEHINSPTPHPAYDDGPSLLLLYNNVKV